MLNKGLEYLQALFAVLADNDYQLGDQEANSFMPYLMIKVGVSLFHLCRSEHVHLVCKYPTHSAHSLNTFILLLSVLPFIC